MIIFYSYIKYIKYIPSNNYRNLTQSQNTAIFDTCQAPGRTPPWADAVRPYRVDGVDPATRFSSLHHSTISFRRLPVFAAPSSHPRRAVKPPV